MTTDTRELIPTGRVLVDPSEPEHIAEATTHAERLSSKREAVPAE